MSDTTDSFNTTSSSPPTIVSNKQQLEQLLSNWESQNKATKRRIENELEQIEKQEQVCLRSIQSETEKLVQMIQERSQVLEEELKRKCKEYKEQLAGVLKEKLELNEVVKSDTPIGEEDVNRVEKFVRTRRIEQLEKFHSFTVLNLESEKLRDLISKFGKGIYPTINVIVDTPVTNTTVNSTTSTEIEPIVSTPERRPRNASFMRIATPTQQSPRSVASPSLSSKLFQGLSNTAIKFDDNIKESYSQVRNSEDLSYTIMEYDEKDTKLLKTTKIGSHLQEVIDEMKPEKALYAIIRVGGIEFDDVKRDKYAFVTFIGTQVKPLRRGAITANMNLISDYIGITNSIHLKDVNNLRKEIIDKLNNAGMTRPREYVFYE